MTWKPTSSLEAIQARAQLYRDIRQFFYERKVLEVETPLLSGATIPDANIHSLTTQLFDNNYYLQTSPEIHMKRLLANGVGSIYQLGKAFRDDEFGKHHNPEFTILEWYRVDVDLQRLMQEMDEFLQYILSISAAVKYTYQQIFIKYLNIDPLTATINQLQQCALGFINIDNCEHYTKDVWLNLLMSHGIEPKLNAEHQQQPVFIYQFPASQAALARKTPNNPLTAERFEVYLGGLELANGFHELADAKEQRQRFLADNRRRKQLGLKEIPLDENFLQALVHGIPNCSGVALGVDRLLMLKLKAKAISEVINFPIDRA